MSEDEDEDGPRRPVRQDAEAKHAPETLDPRYVAWIEARVRGYEDAYGQCEKTARAMVEDFPGELRLVRGHYYDIGWGERGHWWCETLEGGVVVDPTARQFPTQGRGPYVEFLGTDDQLPTGRCMECGEETFEGKTFCTTGCERAYIASLM